MWNTKTNAYYTKLKKRRPAFPVNVVTLDALLLALSRLTAGIQIKNSIQFKSKAQIKNSIQFKKTMLTLSTLPNACAINKPMKTLKPIWIVAWAVMALSACGSISNNNTTANHELAIDNRATNSVKESNRVTPDSSTSNSNRNGNGLALTEKNESNLLLDLKDDNLGIGFDIDNTTAVWYSNFDDELWLGWAATFDNDVTLGFAVSSKTDKGNIYTAGWGYSADITGNLSANTTATYSMFKSSNENYADSTGYDLNAWLNYKVSENVMLDGSIGSETITSDWYDSENETYAEAWATYLSEDFSVRVAWQVKEWANQVNAILSVPLWKSNKTSSSDFSNFMARKNIVNKWVFNDSYVKVKKVEETVTEDVETPISTPTISMADQSISDNGWFSSTTLAAPTVSWIETWADYSITYTITSWNLDIWYSITVDEDTGEITFFWDALNPSVIEITETVTNPDGWTQSTTFDLSVSNDW